MNDVTYNAGPFMLCTSIACACHWSQYSITSGVIVPSSSMMPRMAPSILRQLRPSCRIRLMLLTVMRIETTNATGSVTVASRPAVPVIDRTVVPMSLNRMMFSTICSRQNARKIIEPRYSTFRY